MDRDRTMGMIAAASAYAWWGFIPLYFAAIAHVPVAEIVAHRIAGTVLALSAVLLLQRRLGRTFMRIREPGVARNLAMTTGLLGINWFVFVIAVAQNRTSDAALGYFLNPVLNIALGVFFLRERLTPVQWACVAFASIGVGIRFLQIDQLPWISLTLAATFALYGLLRKRSPLGPTQGLYLEMVTAFLPAIAFTIYVWQRGTMQLFTIDRQTDVLLLIGGLITMTPLLLFATGARRLPYSWMGFLQYIAPSLQLMVALVFLGETIGTLQWVSFGFVWAGLLLLVLEYPCRSLWKRMQPAATRPAPLDL